jgi:hypothetical protein
MPAMRTLENCKAMRSPLAAGGFLVAALPAWPALDLMTMTLNF